MKKLLAVFLTAAMLLVFAACRRDPGVTDPSPAPGATSEADEWYKSMFNSAMMIVRMFDEQLLDRIIYPGQLEALKKEYREKKDQDYIELLRRDYEAVAAGYTETYGEDWRLSYKINEIIDKDAEGIENYKKFDSHYFKAYNVDTDKIDAVAFVKLTVTIKGSLGENSKDKTIQCFRIDGKWYSFYALRLGVKL